MLLFTNCVLQLFSLAYILGKVLLCYRKSHSSRRVGCGGTYRGPFFTPSALAKMHLLSNSKFSLSFNEIENQTNLWFFAAKVFLVRKPRGLMHFYSFCTNQILSIWKTFLCCFDFLDLSREYIFYGFT